MIMMTYNDLRITDCAVCCRCYIVESRLLYGDNYAVFVIIDIKIML